MECDDPADVRERLELLRIEHRLAVSIGLDADREYMADLERQLDDLGGRLDRRAR